MSAPRFAVYSRDHVAGTVSQPIAVSDDIAEALDQAAYKIHRAGGCYVVDAQTELTMVLVGWHFADGENGHRQ